MSNGWIGVDLDGTLAFYDRWVAPTHIGAPVPVMVDRVKTWLAEGREVRIFTARINVPDADMQYDTIRAIRAWCKEHVGQELLVTCIKDMEMLELWDDRAIQVEPNTGRRAWLPGTSQGN